MEIKEVEAIKPRNYKKMKVMLREKGVEEDKQETVLSVNRRARERRIVRSSTTSAKTAGLRSAEGNKGRRQAA